MSTPTEARAYTAADLKRIANAAAARAAATVRAAALLALRKTLKGQALRRAVAAVEALPLVTGVNLELR